MICNLYIFLNTCKLLELVRSVCNKFHNFTPYIEMHIDFTLVWARWTVKVHFWRVSYICTRRLNIFCKLSGSILWYALNIIIDVLNLTKSTNFKIPSWELQTLSVWELQTLSGDGSPRRQRKESDDRTGNMTMTLQTVWSNMSISNPPLQPPTHASNITNVIFIIIIILDDSDHHTRSRGIARYIYIYITERGVLQGDIFSPVCFIAGLDRIFRLYDQVNPGMTVGTGARLHIWRSLNTQMTQPSYTRTRGKPRHGSHRWLPAPSRMPQWSSHLRKARWCTFTRRPERVRPRRLT